MQRVQIQYVSEGGRARHVVCEARLGAMPPDLILSWMNEAKRQHPLHSGYRTEIHTDESLAFLDQPPILSIPFPAGDDDDAF